MKVFSIFLLTFLTLWLIGCGEDESSSSNVPTTTVPNELVGTWNEAFYIEQTGTNTYQTELMQPPHSASLTLQSNGNWVYTATHPPVTIRETGRSRWLGNSQLRVYFDTVSTGSGHQAGDSVTFTCLYTNEQMSLTAPLPDQPQFTSTTVFMKQNATSGSLIGLVRDNQGRGIQGVVIALDNPTVDVPAPRDTTDQYGFFSVGGLAPGTYPLIATYQNQTRNANAVITQGGMTSLVLTMSGGGGGGGTGTIRGTIRDVNTSAALNGVTVTTDNQQSTTTNANGEYTLTVSEGLRILTATLNTYHTATAVVFVNANQTVQQDLYLASVQATPGTVTGTVTNAVNNQPIQGATVQVSGGPSTTTDAQGNYTLTVEAGSRAIFVTKTGFYPSNVTILQVMSNQTVTQNFSLSPEFVGGSGRFRLVLRWGTNPRDLDSHLLTPNNGHVAYFSPGDSLNSPYARLDVDDTDGEGPETITIYQFQNGTYRYYIHNYSGTPDITTSNAVVYIYDENGLLNQLSIPTSPVNGSRYWYVCDIDGATRRLTVVNQLVSTPPTLDDDWIWAHPKE
ncbi:MAG: carboxypeptidase regulatory-like domain-containing protein [bacterium]|nr:carboxypeptidase regulatory-like domain-containing protein [bacterium]